MSLSIVLGMPTIDFFETAPFGFGVEFHRAAQRAVASDHEEKVDLHFLEQIDHLADFLRAARAAEDGAAEIMDLRYGLRLEQHRGVAVARDQALVAIAEAEDSGDRVAVVKLRDDATNDVVQPGAQAPASDDGRGGLRGIEEDLLARTGGLEAELAGVRLRSGIAIQRVVEEHAFLFFAEAHLDPAPDVAQRRHYFTRP